MHSTQTAALVRLAPLFAAIALTACGASPEPTPQAAAPQDAPAPPPATPPGTPAPSPGTPPVGTPRILVNDAPTVMRLRQLLADGANSAMAPATRFKVIVDQQMLTGNIYGFEPWYAALLSQVTGTVSYCTYAVAQTEAFVASEEALIAQGQAPEVASDSYLDVGPIVGNVSLVYDWCRPQMTDTQRARWRNYGNQAVWNLWKAPVSGGQVQARWGNNVFPWSGWSLDNPVNNYYYSFLEATMLLGLATRGETELADEWLNQFRVAKLQNQLFPTFQQQLTGGGSREGTGYGTAMKNLWQLYDWWERSTGERIADKVPHTLASLAAMMHSVVPTLDRIAPTGDHARDSSAALFDYHRDYMQKLIRLFPQERLSGVARTLLEQSSVPRMANPFMYYSDWLYEHSDVPSLPLDTLSPAYYAPGTGQFTMRHSWNDRYGAWANVICGPYTESHAHQDQGTFTLFRVNWQAYDANIDSHSGLEQEAPKHNLVSFEGGDGSPLAQHGAEQACRMLALADDARFSYAAMDATPAWASNANGSVVLSQREFVFLRPGTFVVFDRVQTSGTGMRRIWNLNVPTAPVDLSTNHARFINAAGSQLEVWRLAPTTVAWQSAPWGAGFDSPSATHLQAVDSTGDTSQFLHVLATNGSTGNVVRSDAPGQVGVVVTFPNNAGTATVRFNTTGSGGTLDLRDGAGNVLRSGPLPTGIQALPLYAH